MKSENVIALDISTCVILLGFLLMRLFVRYHHRTWKSISKGWLLSDMFVTLACALAMTLAILDAWMRLKIINFKKETERRGSTNMVVYFQNAKQELENTFINEIGFVTLMWCIKASFLISYLGMAQFLSRLLRMALYISGTALLATWIAMMLILTLWCQPITDNWNISNYCSAQTSPAQTIIFFVLHMGTDIPVLTLPIFILRTLKLGTGEKYALFFVYVLGILTLVTTTTRFVLHYQTALQFENTTLGLEQSKSKIEKIYLVSLAEVFASGVLVCLPSMRVLLRIILRATGLQTHTEKTIHGDVDSEGFEMIHSNNNEKSRFEH